jgi:hypothetical protein
LQSDGQKTFGPVVLLADKISNLRDIQASPPADWSTERKQAYFDWAAAVVAGLRGVHPGLEAVFDGLYARRLTVKAKSQIESFNPAAQGHRF